MKVQFLKKHNTYKAGEVVENPRNAEILIKTCVCIEIADEPAKVEPKKKPAKVETETKE